MAEVDLEKRRTTRILAGLALNAGAQMLGISTAHAAVSVDCPIYMFHGISQGGAAVDNIIRTNARAGRIPVSISQLSAILLGEAEKPAKPLFALTFDDGLVSQYNFAKPVLDRYGAEATFYIIGGLMDGSWEGDRVHDYMDDKKVQDLAALGYDIASHSVDHGDLVRIQLSGDPTKVSDEIYHSKEKLEAVIDQEVTSFSYPNGSYTSFTRQLVIEAGYKAAVSVQSGRIQNDGSIHDLRRTRA